LNERQSSRDGGLGTARQVRWTAVAIFALTIYGSLIPFDYESRPIDEAWTAFRQIALTPPSILEARGDWIITVVQIMVLSFLCIAAFAVDRSVWIGRISSIVVVPFFVALAVGIEFVQLYFPPRTVSINDIMCAAIGAVLGSFVWLIGGQRIIHWFRRVGTVSTLDALTSWVVPAYLVVLLIVQLMPFDFVVSRDELAIKNQEGKINLTPFSGLGNVDGLIKITLNVACFFPLGFLMNIRLAKKRTQTVSFPSFVLLAPLFVEVLQLFVYSRAFEVTDIFTGMLGVIFGAWVATKSVNYIRYRRAPNFGLVAARPGTTVILLALVLVWASAVIYLNWRPFNFGIDLSGLRELRIDEEHPVSKMTWLPFVDYYWGSKYNALDQFVRKGLSFVPLGALFALTARNVFAPGGVRKVIVVALLAGVVIETGRYFLPDRNATVTDVLIGCAGAALGYWFFKFVRATVWTEIALYGWMQPILPKSNGQSRLQ